MTIETDPAARPGPAILEQFAQVLREFSPSCLVTDAHPGVGAIGGLRAVDPGHRIAGPALTVDVPPDELVDILPVLGLARPGDVVVIACHGVTGLAMWGGVMATLGRMAGLAGVVVDGAVRDVDELRALGFPAWYRDTHPRRCPPAGPRGAAPFRANVPVRIGEAAVHPGDIVVADENGVGVVPAGAAGAVLDGVRLLLAKEADIRGRITAGTTLPELLAEFGHL
jgi:4-hydroxy-4-methyl-2-oxoglutarate aldolase